MTMDLKWIWKAVFNYASEAKDSFQAAGNNVVFVCLATFEFVSKALTSFPCVKTEQFHDTLRSSSIT